MELEQVILRLPDQTLKGIDSLADEKQQSREQLLIEIVEEYLRRASVRKKILELREHRRGSARERLAFKRMNQLRSKVKRVPEKILNKDIEEAIKAVRKPQRD